MKFYNFQKFDELFFNRIKLEDGELKKFLEETKDLSSSERGHKLVAAGAISETHKDFALEGQTEVQQ